MLSKTPIILKRRDVIQKLTPMGRDSSANAQSDDVQRHLAPMGSQNAVEQFEGTTREKGQYVVLSLSFMTRSLTPETLLVPSRCRLRWVWIIRSWCCLGAPVLQKKEY